MDFNECIQSHDVILMEGALAERLRHECGLKFNQYVALAGLVYDDIGKRAICNLWKEYIDIALRYQLPFMATTPTRRANYANVRAAQYDVNIILDNVAMLRDIRDEINIDNMYIGGLMGCFGDAYSGKRILSQHSAHKFHSWQTACFAKANVDFLFAGIMPEIEEAVGMAQAMSDTDVPYIISFMVRLDGRLLDGTTIADAIYRIDKSTKNRPLCYMANCVHPRNLYMALKQPFNDNELMRQRFWGIQANASPLSPEELDGSQALCSSNPEELALNMVRLYKDMSLRIFGGCCGTDRQHMEAVSSAVCAESRKTHSRLKY